MKIIPFESPDDESGDELPIHMQEKILSHPAIIGAGESKFPIIIAIAAPDFAFIHHLISASSLKDFPIISIDDSDRSEFLVEDFLEFIEKSTIKSEMVRRESLAEMMVIEYAFHAENLDACRNFIPEIAKTEKFRPKPIRPVLKLPSTYG